MEYVLIALVIVLISIGQVLQKLGADRWLQDIDGVAELVRALFHREILLSALCLGTAIMLWLVVLYGMDVSKAYPFLSIGFVLVMLASHFCFREEITPARWIGVLLVACGTALLSQS